MELWARRSYESNGLATVVLGHDSLKISGGLMVGFALAGTPFHEEAVAQTSEHPHHPNPFGILDTATIIVVRNIQTLVSATFNAPGVAVEPEPFCGRKLLGRGAGDQGDQFVFAPFDLTQEQGRLLGQRKADLLGR